MYFFRNNLKQCQKKLTKDEFKRRSRQWGRQWRQLSSQGQQKFKIDSEYEQSCREELATRGLCGDRFDLVSEGVAQEGGIHLPPDALSAEQLELVAGAGNSCYVSQSMSSMSRPIGFSLQACNCIMNNVYNLQ